MAKSPRASRPATGDGVPVGSSPIPADVFEVLVEALATALVLEYEHDVVGSPVDARRRDGPEPQTRGGLLNGGVRDAPASGKADLADEWPRLFDNRIS